MTPERWEKIGRLYEAASELEPALRQSFLDHACASDGELRREVESLLQAEASVGPFLAAPALQDAAQLLTAEAPGELVGKQFGHYQILSFIGAGGMGEVYAAKDARLGRKVALKLLPAAAARDSVRLRRFEQEARAVGMLNHPNILTIHDIGTHENTPYLVSELLEGETLRARLKGAPLPQRKAVDVALQITRGLAAAHERGIVHRDLKPENLFITKDERVKILDFGLAKLTERRGDGATGRRGNENTSSPISQPHSLTDPGVVMGTAGYMAPEQVRGHEADTRADIFAFGVILHEMLAGARPFRGETAAETMNAILNSEPPALPALLRTQAPGLERVIHRCLEKRPELRFQSASDLGFALEALTAATLSLPNAAAEAPTRPLPRGIARSWRNRLGWLAAGLLALTSLFFGVAYFRRPAGEVEPLRLALTPPENAVRIADPALSPDGRRLAFVAFAEGKALLWVRPLSSLMAQPLPGTDGANGPFWSPDGKAIGFFAQGKLKKIALSGEPPVTLCDAPTNRGGAWNRDGVILFVPHQNAGVQRVSANGGTPAAVTQLAAERQESSHLWPSFLPDGRHFLYLVNSAQTEQAGLYVAALDGGAKQRLFAATSGALYANARRNGYLLFARDGALLAQAFDPERRELAGEPQRLAEEIGGSPFGKAGFSAAGNGVLVYDTSVRNTDQQPGWFDRAGKQLALLGSPGSYLSAALAPDETRVAVARVERQTRASDIWLLDLARGAEQRFTLDQASDLFPLWSPDGSRLAWTSMRESVAGIYQKATNGAGEEELLFRSSHQKHPTDWSKDGRFLLFQDSAPKTKWDIWMLPLAAPPSGERQPLPFAQTPANETSARLSPDGRWIAWTSDESGNNEVYVQAFQPSGQPAGGRWQISSKGGDQPRWRRDGKELFYLARDGKLMAVAVTAGATFTAGAPQELFDLRGLRAMGGNYAAAGDGRRFLITTSLEETSAAPFTVMLNWAAGLSR
jgi:serine/threonine protein kinase/Tol biopolymer transport system component